MADPKIALASIGKSPATRTGPPPLIRAIKNDLIKVNHDPSKASTQLIHVVPKAKPSNLVFLTSGVNVDLKAIEAEIKEDMSVLGSPSRRLSLTKPFRSSNSSLLHKNQTSTLEIAERRKSSKSLVSAETSSLGIITSSKPSISLASKRKGSGSTTNPTEHLPHGFRYHSNGDERILQPSDSSETCSSSNLKRVVDQMEEARSSFSNLHRLRHQILGHPPRMPSSPMANLAASRLKKVTKEVEEAETPGMMSRRRGEAGVEFQETSSVTDTSTVQKGDNMFKQTILRYIRDMAQSGKNHGSQGHSRSTPRQGRAMLDAGGGSSHSILSARPSIASTVASPAVMSRRLSNTAAPELLGAPGSTKEITLDEEMQKGLQSATLSGCLTAGNSSFNMRYGVPVKLMAQRKHILDEQHHKELEETHRNNMEIVNFLENLKDPKKTKGRPPPLGPQDDSSLAVSELDIELIK